MSGFRNDAILWYNVPGWSELGLAVPNFGNDTHSLNSNVVYLCGVMGRNLQAFMFHTDAGLTTPPSINTLLRVHRLCIRARDILASRAIPANQPNMESPHNTPAPEVFRVYPTPYFRVRNKWMREWCGLLLLGIADAMQQTENAKPFEISTRLAGLIGQYVHRVYRLMAVELFHVPVDTAEKRDFTLTEEQLGSYNPSQWFTSTELIDTVRVFDQMPTEDDLRPLTDGIPVTHLPKLGPWPSARIDAAGKPEAQQEEGSTSFADPPAA